ncbi:MAG: alanine--tRNA ligase [Bacteroidales bacterium]|nr:alanine--tRNA ligase [Bacteroidales bacterium]
MKSSDIRKHFLDYFESKGHQIVPGAPIVVKDDPTLLFINAGMNQFKDVFLGNSPVQYARIADTQKCLRVSGKHNDLEEVGHDTYHHTLFEMLGNWSFGDYFKKEAISWAWELLTDVYNIDKNNLYVTVFGGDESEGLNPDEEAKDFWKQHIDESRILYGSKKDNFWEMGETGPCGPCSEIHVDLRSDEEKKLIPGKELVNKDHPQVIEIWNLVFIQFNRMANKQLVSLPHKHIDTGMGFERLTMVLQGVRSNYDTDIFTPLIAKLENLSGKKYGSDEKQSIAMRVISDHIRAVAFTIADGQLPSNTGAGYVIRRILRRAVRYGFTFLGFEEAFMYHLVAVLVAQMKDVFPEIEKQQQLVEMVIKEEEQAFLRTLSQGVKRFEQYLESNSNTSVIDGEFAFELFDTFGFPIDLTQLMAREKGLTVDMDGFQRGLAAQKERSRKAAEQVTDDWVEVNAQEGVTRFLGYNSLQCEAQIVKFRKVEQKKKIFYEIVLDQTPFYAESGGQVGDIGVLVAGSQTLKVLSTKKENNLWVHVVDQAPKEIDAVYIAKVDEYKRRLTANNHSATHLMHAALRQVLGTHVEQKGSLVDADRLRFDFAHFAKMSVEEIKEVEKIVNLKIRENISGNIQLDVPIDKAKEMGAMALFGEKYGDKVRVVTFDPEYSVELCGGTHVDATGQIGCFKILSEGAIAAGVRRIEAVTADRAEEYINNQMDTLSEIKELFKGAAHPVQSVKNLIQEHAEFQKQLEQLQKEKALQNARELLKDSVKIGNVSFLAKKSAVDPGQVKNLIHQLRSIENNWVVVLAMEQGEKVNLAVGISDDLVQNNKFHAGNMIREITVHIKGGGGGQSNFAMAGGKDSSGILKALEAAQDMVKSWV